MSSRLLVYSPRRFSPSLLVWLATVLMVAQPLSAASCCCAKAGQQVSDAAKRQAAEEPRFCRHETAGCCASKDVPRPSCCQHTGAASARPGCRCPEACSCKADDSPRPPCPAPPTGRRPTVSSRSVGRESEFHLVAGLRPIVDRRSTESVCFRLPALHPSLPVPSLIFSHGGDTARFLPDCAWPRF